jgi:hypothetical protein
MFVAFADDPLSPRRGEMFVAFADDPLSPRRGEMFVVCRRRIPQTSVGDVRQCTAHTQARARFGLHFALCS